MNVHFAVIMHEYGSTGFVASNSEDLYRQLAAWCEEYEAEHMDTPRATVEFYFSDDGPGWQRGELLFVHEELLV